MSTNNTDLQIGGEAKGHFVRGDQMVILYHGPESTSVYFGSCMLENPVPAQPVPGEAKENL